MIEFYLDYVLRYNFLMILQKKKKKKKKRYNFLNPIVDLSLITFFSNPINPYKINYPK